MNLFFFRCFFTTVLFVISGMIGWSYQPEALYVGLGGLGGLSMAFGLFWSERYIRRTDMGTMFGGTLGGAIGITFGRLLGSLVEPVFHDPHMSGLLALIPVALFGYAGVYVGVKKIALIRWADIQGYFNMGGDVRYKILDTSVIIDGRILDICAAGFLEGVLVAPRFVLLELQHIADSSDSIKRNRGRRGLDILNKLQKSPNYAVEIHETDFPDIREVDSKLIQLSKVLGGKLLTNDMNLYKVAELQGVSVLNINELANALKPVVLPGEDMAVLVVKEGKEQGQGIGYLDDGTMIVVENGTRVIGKEINVVVTSVLQTTAGRMIFSKMKEEESAQRGRWR